MNEIMDEKVPLVFLEINKAFGVSHSGALLRLDQQGCPQLAANWLRDILTSKMTDLSSEEQHVRRLLESGHLWVAGYRRPVLGLRLPQYNSLIVGYSKQLREGNFYPSFDGFCPWRSVEAIEETFPQIFEEVWNPCRRTLVPPVFLP